jgi:dTDP-4-amino-4,6-dideoxygalactose transaminase
MINLFEPSVGDDELAALVDVFASHWLGNGERTLEFERAFGIYLGRPATEITAVSSCTEGLFQIVTALGLGPGDDVVIPSISFIGAAHAVRSSGAHVVPCDVDPRTLNPSLEHVAQAITPATKAIVILHYGGAPGAVVELADLAEERSLLLVEDAACALGSSVGGRSCGTFGHVGVWSFDAAKVLTTGEGGMIWSRNEDLVERLRSAIRLGVSSSGFDRRGNSGRWWEINPSEVGRRATMNDIAAAIGLVQIDRLEVFLRRRRKVATTYSAALADQNWLQVPPHHPAEVADTFYWLRLDPKNRDRLAVHLLDRGIYTNFRYWPLHRMTMYRSEVELHGADEAADSTLLIPVHQSLSDADVEHVINSVIDFSPRVTQ